MKMYACRRYGKVSTIGTTWHFTGVRGFDRERCALKCNKLERELFYRAGFDVDAATEEWGSAWLNTGEIKRVMEKLERLDGLKPREEDIVDAIIHFMKICLEQGYQIRFY